MNVEAGFKRVFAVVSIGWVLVWLVIAINLGSEFLTESDALFFVAIAGLPVLIGYILCFVAIPWIVSGFKGKR